MSDKEMNEILDGSLDEKELDEIAGGKCRILGSWGNGSCDGSFYAEKCAASVEANSLCGSDDYCKIGDVKYHCNGNSSYMRR